MLHLVPLVEPMELSLLLYLRLQHTLRGGLPGLAQYDATDAELAAWVGYSARSLRRWRKDRYLALKTAVKVLIPEIEQIVDYFDRLPVVVGYRYTFLASDPELTPSLLSEARVYAKRAGRKPFPERLQDAQDEFAADRIRRGLLPQARAESDIVSGAGAAKLAGLSLDKPSGATVAKSSGFDLDTHEIQHHDNHDHEQDPYTSYETPGVSPRARRDYERWLWAEIHRLNRNRPLKAKEYYAFLKWYRRIGDGPATRAAARVRETTQERSLGDPLAYLMTTMKGLAK
jgi:hypothetical protein